MPMIRVVLADDHAVVRKGIREFLEKAGDIQVVAEAADGEEALALVAEHLPDVLVLDIQMPRLSGLEVTRRVAAEHPSVRILALTAYDDDPYVFALLKTGATGYILKTADSDELVRAVRAVAAGRSALAPEVAQKVVQQLAGGARTLGDEVVQELSERELQVLRLAGKGLTNRAIGLQLAISDRTVQGHLANIYSKLHVSTRTEAVLKAVRLGWLALDETHSP
ncbi:MAG: response regulator transcription factor [Anaerolineae bacterium]|nr:response regulator transcription factor [Anaerolineae bacterium]